MQTIYRHAQKKIGVSLREVSVSLRLWSCLPF